MAKLKLMRGDTIYNTSNGKFGTVLYESFVGGVVVHEENEVIKTGWNNWWAIADVVKVDPDTPQNRLLIRIKYGC